MLRKPYTGILLFLNDNTRQVIKNGPMCYLPDADEVVTVSGKQGLTVGAPGHGEALRRVSAARPGHLIINHKA